MIASPADELSQIDPLLRPPPPSSPLPVADDASTTLRSESSFAEQNSSHTRNGRTVVLEARWKSAPRRGRYVPSEAHAPVLALSHAMLLALIFTGQTGKTQCSVWPENNESMLDNLINQVWEDSARALACGDEEWPQGVALVCPPHEARKVCVSRSVITSSNLFFFSYSTASVISEVTLWSRLGLSLRATVAQNRFQTRKPSSDIYSE